MNPTQGEKGVDKMMVHAISEYEASIARIIFLCIKNLEFELGANKLAQILTGTQTKFITDYELQNNPAFALLKQYSQGDIKKIIDILEMCGYLDYEEVRKNMSVLVLTKKAKDFLNGNCEFDTSFIDAITETDFVQLDDQQNELYEKLVKDLGETNTKYQGWWNRMANKYQWESTNDGNWEINFDTCKVFLNV